MKKPKLSLKEKRRIKKEKKKNKQGRSFAKCPKPYDRIIATTNKTRVRDQEEKNKIFTIY